MKKFFYVSAFIFASVTSFDKAAYADACDDAMNHVRQLGSKNLNFVASNIHLGKKRNESKALLDANPSDPRAIEWKKDIEKSQEVGVKFQENMKEFDPALAMVKSACVNADKKKMDGFDKEGQEFFQKINEMFKK
ncbi:MAG: hypothetical protein Q8K37_07125 [Alphaproteobacteria bacterium]|nr:hypothetical protein [Alphaproteobacteria bacterium]